VIPVIDFRHGTTVHAVGGHREAYRPLETDMSADADPIEVAVGFRDRFGFDELYVADLDGIIDGSQNIPLLSGLCGVGGMSVMVDSGVANAPNAKKLLEVGAAKVIVGSETLDRLDVAEEIVDSVGGSRSVGSIDVVNGSVLSRCDEISGVKPDEAARLFESSGVGELILLDLSRVGLSEGIDVRPIEETAEAVNIPILVGGGVNSIEDIVALKKAGAAGVLMSTALHDGRVSRGALDVTLG
jgi:phosphoribosylformimino-5-aminoimidazole carboxamide ribotide isomerase